MARKIICDKCGKMIENGEKWFNLKSEEISTDFQPKHFIVQLCEGCEKEVEESINKSRK